MRELLDEAIAGHGHVATVVGEAGIGKTRLVSTLVAEALSQGCRVLIGRCHESDSILPFGPWVDACRGGEVSADEEILGALHPARRAELTRLLARGGHGRPPPASDSALPLFESVAELIEQVAARQPLVLVLEDLHWADEMSLRLLAFVSRRIPAWTALLVATAREEELADAVDGAANDGGPVPRVRRRVPWCSHPCRDPTPPCSCGRSLASGATPRRWRSVEAQIWAMSEGNPFVAVEAMRALDQDSLPDGAREAPGALALPARVRRSRRPAARPAQCAQSAGGGRGRGHRAPVRLHAAPLRQRHGRARRGGGGRGDGASPRAPGRGEPAGLHP